MKQGYRILARNWRCEAGELDLVAQDGETLVFVEIRTRRGERCGTAAESVTLAKQTRLIELAQSYLQAQGWSDVAWRIDVVALDLTPQGRLKQVSHLQSAVES